MTSLTPDVIAVVTNSLGVYFQVSTGKADRPATVKRTRSLSLGRGGFTYLCLSCLTNDACAHARASMDYFDAYGTTSPTPRAVSEAAA